ncbi:MAG: PDZ domain-containing protein [Phycisphaerales bacterium JB040]
MTLMPLLSVLLAAGTALAASEVRVFETDPPAPANSDDIIVVEPEDASAVYEWAGADGRHGQARVISTQPETRGTYRIRSTDHDQTIEIRIEDGKVVKVERNGKGVPESRYTFDDGVVIIYDADGNVVHEHSIHAPDAPTPPAGYTFGPKVIRLDNGNFSVNVQPEIRFAAPGDGVVYGLARQPRVMLGINQSVPDAALRYHLGLGEDQQCILIERVIPGLPADKAGMKQYDILIQADGEGVDALALRELLAEKEPGEDVTFRVIRKGDRKELTVELEAYDASKLGVTTAEGFFTPAPDNNIFVAPRPPSPPDAQPAPRGWIERFEAPGFEGAFEFDIEAFSDPEKAEEAVRKLREQIEKHRENMQFDGNRLFITEELPKIRARVEALSEEARKQAGEGAEQVLRRAEEAAEEAEQLAGRLAPLASERLDRIESRLDTLEGTLSERLEKLFERLDTISERLKDAGAESEEGEI